MYFLAIVLFSAGISLLLNRRLQGHGPRILALLCAWVMGISLALLLAALAKPEVAHPGWGVEGEKNYYSFAIITTGFWLALLGSVAGLWLGGWGWRRTRAEAPLDRPANYKNQRALLKFGFLRATTRD